MAMWLFNGHANPPGKSTAVWFVGMVSWRDWVGTQTCLIIGRSVRNAGYSMPELRRSALYENMETYNLMARNYFSLSNALWIWTGVLLLVRK